jgi:hypothetical protein
MDVSPIDFLLGFLDVSPDVGAFISGLLGRLAWT